MIHVSVDSTNFWIKEPGPVLNPKFNSPKFKGPAVCYKIVVIIVTGEIVWIHWPFPAGAWLDIKIFRDLMVESLDDSEKVLADSGYQDGYTNVVTIKSLQDFVKKQAAVLLSRHKLVNRQFKVFCTLGCLYRYNRVEYSLFMHSCTLLVQMNLCDGSGTYVAGSPALQIW